MVAWLVPLQLTQPLWPIDMVINWIVYRRNELGSEATKVRGLSYNEKREGESVGHDVEQRGTVICVTEI